MNNDDAWTLALIIGLVAALIVAGLLLLLIKAVRDIESSVNGLLERRHVTSPPTPPTSRSCRPPRRCSAMIVDEAVVQDGYMNALTDGYGVKV